MLIGLMILQFGIHLYNNKIQSGPIEMDSDFRNAIRAPIFEKIRCTLHLINIYDKY